MNQSRRVLGQLEVGLTFPMQSLLFLVLSVLFVLPARGELASLRTSYILWAISQAGTTFTDVDNSIDTDGNLEFSPSFQEVLSYRRAYSKRIGANGEEAEAIAISDMQTSWRIDAGVFKFYGAAKTTGGARQTVAYDRSTEPATILGYGFGGAGGYAAYYFEFEISTPKYFSFQGSLEGSSSPINTDSRLIFYGFSNPNNPIINLERTGEIYEVGILPAGHYRLYSDANWGFNVSGYGDSDSYLGSAISAAGYWRWFVYLSDDPLPANTGDFDGDGVPDLQDNCPVFFNPAQLETDTCSADSENDTDSDTVLDDVDNCPATYNPDQLDSNGDGYGDACVNATTTIPANATVDRKITIGEFTTINKGVAVGANSVIGSYTILERDVTIGTDAKIGDSTIVNKSASVGDGTIIGDSVIVDQKAWIGKGVSIGDAAMIGQSAVICSGAQIGKGAVVGKYVLIQTNAAVLDGATINASKTNEAPSPTQCN